MKKYKYFQRMEEYTKILPQKGLYIKIRGIHKETTWMLNDEDRTHSVSKVWSILSKWIKFTKCGFFFIIIVPPPLRRYYNVQIVAFVLYLFIIVTPNCVLPLNARELHFWCSKLKQKEFYFSILNNIKKFECIILCMNILPHESWVNPCMLHHTTWSNTRLVINKKHNFKSHIWRDPRRPHVNMVNIDYYYYRCIFGLVTIRQVIIRHLGLPLYAKNRRRTQVGRLPKQDLRWTVLTFEVYRRSRPSKVVGESHAG